MSYQKVYTLGIQCTSVHLVCNCCMEQYIILNIPSLLLATTMWHPHASAVQKLLIQVMQNKGYITIEDSLDIGKLEQTAHKIAPSIKVILPSIFHDESVFKSTTLIILCGDEREAREFLQTTRAPEAVPILYLGNEVQIQRLFEFNQITRFLDYLTLPISVELFLHKLQILSRVYKLSIENKTQTTNLNQQLKIFHNRDGLTGLFTRRHLTDQLQTIMNSSRKENKELSLLILNIDYFNNVNKFYGLEFGDFLLNAMAARLTSTTPDSATCYRFSGEDFVVLLPETDIKSAIEVAEKVNKICSETPFGDGNLTASITLSVGISSLKEHLPKNHTEFLCMAETALFGAKANGRNRTQTYSQHGESGNFSAQHNLAILKENLNKILDRTRSSAISSLQLLTSSIAEPGHQEHIDMVSKYLDLFAEELRLPEHYIQTFRNSITLYSSFRCLLHKDIYSKPEKLSPEERRIIQDLPFKLNELVDMFDYFANERSILLGHCERFDGSGYPLGLERDEIPLGARIFHIVDALAAMNGDRPYRKRLTPRQILEEFFDGAGTQFDPQLVGQIFSMIEKYRLIEVEPLDIEEKQQQLFDKFPDLKL